MEKIIIEPREVRGLGDIVSPRDYDDFTKYNNTIQQVVDTNYGIVFQSSYKVGSYFVVTSSDFVTTGDSFTVSAYLKRISDDAYITSGTVKCIVNDTTEYTGTLTGNGVSFTVPIVEGVSYYRVLLKYNGSNSIGGCSQQCSVTVLESSDYSVICFNGMDSAVARVLDLNNEPVKNAPVTFYRTGLSIQVPVRWMNIDNSESTQVYALLLDEDGDPIEDATVSFFKNDGSVFDTADTDSNGECNVTFTPTSVDDDAVYATATVDDENYLSNLVDVVLTSQEYATVSASVEFTEDVNDRDGNRPSSISVVVFIGDQEVPDTEVTLNSANDWTYTWDTLPKYSNGVEINYHVVVTSGTVNDYTMSISHSDMDYTVVCNYTPEMQTTALQIAWYSGDSASFRPATIYGKCNWNDIRLPITEAVDWIVTASVPVRKNKVAYTPSWSLEPVQNYMEFSRQTVDGVTTIILRYFNNPY